ncbi:MAG: hypothetical protein ACR2JM_08455 [Mycobacterium sp.]
MTYRLAIFPAWLLDSAHHAEGLLDLIGEGACGEPAGEAAELLQDLVRRCAGEFSVLARDECGIVIATSGPDRHVYETLVWLTTNHDAAVYDPQARRLYHPRGRVELEVSVGGVLELPYLTVAILRDLVLRPLWPDPQCPFATVARAEEEFIQFFRRDDGFYQVEYREGGQETQFGVDLRESERVIEVMWAWTREDPGWRTALPWGPVEFESEPVLS